MKLSPALRTLVTLPSLTHLGPLLMLFPEPRILSPPHFLTVHVTVTEPLRVCSESLLFLCGYIHSLRECPVPFIPSSTITSSEKPSWFLSKACSESPITQEAALQCRLPPVLNCMALAFSFWSLFCKPGCLAHRGWFCFVFGRVAHDLDWP